MLLIRLLGAMILCGPVLAAAAEALPLVTVEGHVYVEGGNPLATTRVGIFDSLKPASSQCPRSIKPEACLEYLFSIGADRAHAVTGADGRFELQVPGGLVSTDILRAEAENPRGERLRISGPISLIHSLPTTTLGDIRLHLRAYDLIVQVRSDGKPVANAQVVFAYGTQERTDDTGSVSKQLDGQSGTFAKDFMVRAAGFATAEWGGEIAPGTTTQVIELVRESVLSGRITDAGGRPLAQAVLTAMPVASPVGAFMGRDGAAGTTRSDAAGAFTLHGLRAGQQYRILIETDDLSVANGERIVTAGSDPLDIVMNAAVPVKLTISGLYDRLAVMLYTRKQRAPMPKVPAVISERDRAFAYLNKKNIGRALVSQLDLVPTMFDSIGAANTVIFMEWLDPAGAWLQVSSPRHVKFKSATRADLQFDQVPVGTIRIRTMRTYVQEDFDPVTIRAGHTNVIPVRMTAYRPFVVRVVDRKGRPVSGAQLDASSDNVPLYTFITTEFSPSPMGLSNPLKDLKITVTVAGKIVSTTLIKGSAAPPDRLEVHIRLK